MKPETVEAVRLALHPLFQWSSSHDAVQAAIAALTTTDEYKALVADAELGRAWIWQFSENNDDATPETFRTLRDRTQARADDIDAARNGR